MASLFRLTEMLKAMGSSMKKRDQRVMVMSPKNAGMADTSFHISSSANSAGSVGISRPSAKQKAKPPFMNMFVSMPYEAILCVGKVSQIDLPMMRVEQLPTQPSAKRPKQIKGKFLKQVQRDPMTAML